MKVLDNLENYDIPKGFHLTPDEEDRFAADIENIVRALIPIRFSKFKTRKYFNGHLRYTSNVKDYLALPDTPEDKYEFGESYKPFPGEYTWNSDLLQQALLDVLLVDECIFGYAINFLGEDLQSRGIRNPKASYRYSDSVVRFCLKFDLDEIRSKAKSIEDPSERLSYLNEVDADYKLDNSLNRDEEEWLCPSIGRGIATIIDEAKAAYELWKDKKKIELKENVISFDPIKLEGSVMTPEEYVFNQDKFVKQLSPILCRSYNEISETLNLQAVEAGRNLIQVEFSTFLAAINVSGWQDTAELLALVDDWAEDVRTAIDYALYVTPAFLYVNTIDTEKATVKSRESVDNTLFAAVLVQELYIIVGKYKATILINNRESAEILYLVWKGDHKDLLAERERLERSFGEVEKKLQITDQAENIKVFYDRLLWFAKHATIEAVKCKESAPANEKFQETFGYIEQYFRKWLSEYINILFSDEHYPYHPQYEVRVWFEVTRYCTSVVFSAVVKNLASSTQLKMLCDARAVQVLYMDCILPLLDTMWEEKVSKTGDQQLDEYENDLSKVNVDANSKVIPDFDASTLDDKFVTFDEWRQALGYTEEDEKQDEMLVNAWNSFREKQNKAFFECTRWIKANRLSETTNQQNERIMIAEDGVEEPPKVLEKPMCRLNFYDNITSEERNTIIGYMHNHIGIKPGVGELLYVKALVDANILKYPSFQEFAKEFPAYKGKGTIFSNYFGLSGAFYNELSGSHQQKGLTRKVPGMTIQRFDRLCT